jgi:hypothetical protein
MSVDKVSEIVRRAMADRSVYDAMVVRENEVWGKILPDRERSESAIEDAKAGVALRVGRHCSSLTTVARERKVKFEHGLTLGCGAGRCEHRTGSARAFMESISRKMP